MDNRFKAPDMHTSRMQTQASVTSASSTIKEQEETRIQITQPTMAGQMARKLFRALFYGQLTIISILVAVLTIRGLISAQTHHFEPKKWYPPLLTAIAASGLISLTWQFITFCNPSKALKTAFCLSPLLTCSVGILLVLIGTASSAGIGAFFVLFAIIQTLYICWVNPRFEYAAKILSASTAFPPAKTTKIVSLSIFTSVIYSAFLVAGIGGATCTKTGFDILFISIIFLTLVWTMQVIKNLQVVTISRVKYTNFSWGTDLDTGFAFCDTLKNWLGPVCAGSTIVPIIVTIRGSARATNLISGDRDEFLFSCANCYASIGNTLISYGNRWGFVHVGVYGKAFVQASTDTWEMFRSVTGLEQLIDTDLTSSFCFLSGVAVGAISALTGGIWALLIHKDYALEISIYAFFIGYFMCRVAMAWPQACVSAYYVAYAENPESLRFDTTIPCRIQELERYRIRQATSS